jgi:hypothetical protein
MPGRTFMHSDDCSASVLTILVTRARVHAYSMCEAKTCALQSLIQCSRLSYTKP